MVAGERIRGRVLRVLATLALAALIWGGEARATRDAPSWRVPEAARVVAIADVHGDFDALTELLRATGITDETLGWRAGRDRLVLLGNLVDRGPREREVLDLVRRLEGEAVAAGGGVHVLLGPHEVMALVGDFRLAHRGAVSAYVDLESPEARRAATERFLEVSGSSRAARQALEARYPPGWFGRRAAFSTSGPYGTWLASRPVYVVAGDTAFASAGLSPVLAELGPAAVNERVRTDLLTLMEARDLLAGSGALDPEGGLLDWIGVLGERLTHGPALSADQKTAAEALLAAAGSLVFQVDGPLRYRGSAVAPEAVEAERIAAGLHALGADRAVIAGPIPPGFRVTSRFGGRLLVANTGLLETAFRGRVSAVVLTADGARVVYPRENFEEAPFVAGSGPARPVPPPDAVIEDFLRTAAVQKIEEIGIGVTRPRRVTLSKDGATRRAVFKTINESKATKVQLGNRFEMTFSDRFVYDIAAYKLDRMLGLRMVPVTVERTIGRETGSLQDWVEHAVDEDRLISERLDEGDPELIAAQKARMHVFDFLVHNTDRNLGNMIYTVDDLRLFLIDHTRSFRLARRAPEHLRNAALVLPADLKPALEKLDRSALREALAGLLSTAQIDALLARRDMLLTLPVK